MQGGYKNDSDLIFDALRNEHYIDRRDIDKFNIKGIIFEYKALKQASFGKRLRLIFSGLALVWALFVPAFLLFKGLLIFLFNVSGKRLTDERCVWAVPSRSANEGLLKSAIVELGLHEPHFVNARRALSAIAPFLSYRDRFSIFLDVSRLLGSVFSLNSDRIVLLLHARDAVELLILAKFARSRPSDIFVTDCHYQRWSFVLSNASENFVLVQHGFLDLGIELPHVGGIVRTALVRDFESCDIWRRSYRVIESCKIFSCFPKLDFNPYGAKGVFLASSFPSLDVEIQFLKSVREIVTSPIIVKFHPVHSYGRRMNELASLADYVCRPDENPLCGVFVSHSSSMELVYRHWGVPTVSLLSEQSIEAAVDRVVAYLYGGS